MLRTSVFGVAVFLAAASSSGQTPQPFPRPGNAPVGATSPPSEPATATPAQADPVQPSRPLLGSGEPDAAMLGVPLYPTAQFLASYEAGRGQRYYLYGVSAPFAEMVIYYRNQLRDRGNLVFDEPPTHMFEVGRFRDETMAFPPGITVKDWTSGGSLGYPNPVRGAEPARFPTVLLIVPPPTAIPLAR